MLIFVVNNKTIDIMKVESYLPVFPGFYGSIFECDCEEMTLENIEEDTGKSYNYEDIEWDFKDYRKRVSEACVGAIEEELKSEGFDINIEFGELSSPREYNFSNDSIYVTYELSEETFKQLIEYLKDNYEDWEQYLHDRYTSRSGFISFYSTDPKVWLNEYLNVKSSKIDHCFGAVLDFYLENEGYDTESLYYDIDSETGYIDYKLPGEE